MLLSGKFEPYGQSLHSRNSKSIILRQLACILAQMRVTAAQLCVGCKELFKPCPCIAQNSVNNSGASMPPNAQCSHCKEYKLRAEFYGDTSQANGLRPHCRCYFCHHSQTTAFTKTVLCWVACARMHLPTRSSHMIYLTPHKDTCSKLNTG